MKGLSFVFETPRGAFSRSLAFMHPKDFSVLSTDAGGIKFGSHNFIISKNDVPHKKTWDKLKALKEHFGLLARPVYLSECDTGETWLSIYGHDEEIRLSIFKAPQKGRKLSRPEMTKTGGVKIVMRDNHAHNIKMADSHPRGREEFFNHLFDILDNLSSTRKEIHIRES